MPKELVNFLKYVEAPLSESEKDFDDEFVARLQKTVKEVKVSREMGARYMTFQELLSDERKAGRKEEAMRNAYNFFKNGANFELVRASIEGLSDEELQEIYKEAHEFRVSD